MSNDHITRDDIKEIVKESCQLMGAEFKLYVQEAVSSAMKEHFKNCNKVDAWMGKLVFAFIGSGVIVTLIVELIAKK